MALDDLLIERLHQCLGLLRLHHRPSLWIADYVKLIPKSRYSELALLDARQNFECGVVGSIQEALTQRIGCSDPAKVEVGHLIHIVNDWVGADSYYPGPPDPDPGSRLLASALEESVTNQDNCAHLISRKSYLSASTNYLETECAELARELAAAGVDDFSDFPHDPMTRRHWRAVQEFFSRIKPSPEESLIQTLRKGSEFLFDLLKIGRRFPIFATDYALLPQGGQLIVVDAIDQIIVEAAQSPDLIRRLTPRDFERFLKKIFEGFGFDVELTAQTRDGGADLLCMSYAGGIPMKIAVEAKRYNASRPVTVELVRSFVGANAQIHANKLVYVTTSRYTRDAIKYAQIPGITSLLELREFRDIVDWTRASASTLVVPKKGANKAVNPRGGSGGFK